MDALSSTSGIEQFALPRSQQGDGGGLGQEDFLRLMVTQFQNQDPMEPMQNGEFLGQLAQFSTVSGIGDMSDSVGSLANSIQASQALQAATIVGREVLVSGNSGYVGEKGGLAGVVELPEDATALTLRIEDASGQAVRTVQLGPQAAGRIDFHWKGFNVDGDRVAPGEYRVVAEMSDGRSVTGVPTLMAARVDGVSLGQNGNAASITTEHGRQLPLSGVRGIRDGG